MAEKKKPKQKDDEDDPLRPLSIEEVAALLDMPASTVRRLRSCGRGPRTFQVGRRVFVTRAALAEWITKLEGGKD